MKCTFTFESHHAGALASPRIIFLASKVMLMNNINRGEPQDLGESLSVLEHLPAEISAVEV